LHPPSVLGVAHVDESQAFLPQGVGVGDLREGGREGGKGGNE